ncbi:hypothetical protein R5R35_004863 [Gryllus longicercus]|uniref:PWWP domain-containing protein n=1 Tax=Gryllus longicercus TaxID=2509291 RepID=A0AAN9VEL4_9ORTH
MSSRRKEFDLKSSPIVKVRKLNSADIQEHTKRNVARRSNSSKQDEDKSFEPGTLVWAKLTGFPWWPALIVNHTACGMEISEEGKVWVFWFGDYLLSQVSVRSLIPFLENFYLKYNGVPSKSPKFVTSVTEAIKEHCRKTYEVLDWSDQDYLVWGLNNFLPEPTRQKEISSLRYAPYIADKLTEIAAMNSIQKKEIGKRGTSVNKVSKESSQSSVSVNKQAKEAKLSSTAVNKQFKGAIHFGKGKALKNQRQKKQSDSDCLRCNKSATYDHPLFKGKLCEMCMERWKLTFFACDNGSNYINCCVCGYIAHETSVCANEKCGRMYCKYCTQKFEIKMNQQCICLLCIPSRIGFSLTKRESWRMNVFQNYFVTQEGKTEYPSDMFPKEKLTVLSLFENTAKGFQILQDVGININTYFTSSLDVDENDGNISNEKIQNLGNIDLLRSKYLEQMKQIDLVVAYITAMPSFVTTVKKKEFEAPEKLVMFEELIFKFYWTYRDIVHIRKNQHVFWLFAAKEMLLSSDAQRILVRYLQQEEQMEEENDIKFWTNIPCCKPIYNSKSIFKTLSFFFK